MSGTPYVSVVIPSYNAEATLERAVSSCLVQGGARLQVIVVDDCSTDATGKISDRLAREHDPVLVVHNRENKKLLEARRVGALCAKGDYLMFLDADDELEPGCLEAACGLAQREGADIVVMPMHPTYEPGTLPDEQTRVGMERIYAAPDLVAEGDDIVHSAYRDGTVVWNVIGKLFSRQLVRGAFSVVGEQALFQAEDAYLFFVISTRAKRLASSSTIPGYRYSVGTGGTFLGRMMSAGQFARLCDSVRAVRCVRDYLERSGCGDGRFEADYLAMRSRLLLGPASRFPTFVLPEDRSGAFDAYCVRWGTVDVIGALARACWHSPTVVLRAVLESRALRTKLGAVRTVALYCGGLDEGEKTREALWLCGLWRSLGLHVVLLVDEGNEKSEALGVPEGIVVEYVPHVVLCGDGAYPVRARMLCDALKRNGVDALVYGRWLSDLLPWDLLVARSLGIRCVVLARGAFFEPYVHRDAARISYALEYCPAGSVVCPSKVDLAWWGHFVRDVYVEPPVLRSSVYPEPRCHKGGRLVVWSGRFDEGGGALDAVYALRELIRHEPDARLDMVGDCPEDVRATLGSVARAFGVERHIAFSGAIDASRLAQVYGRADVFLMSGHHEALVSSFALAKATGLPCVAYDLPCETLCQPGTGVLTTNVGNADGLGQQLARLFADETLRSNLSAEALAQARELAAYDHADFWKRVLSGIQESPKENPNSGESSEQAMWQCLFDEARRQAASERQGVARIERLSGRLRDMEGQLVRERARGARLQAEVYAARRELEGCRKDLACLTGSVSYKVGRALTKPLRELRDAGRGDRDGEA